MRELTEAMRVATADPPPTSITIDQILVREQRRRTRLRWLAAAGAVVVAAGAAPIVAAVTGPAPAPAPPPRIAPEPDPLEPEQWTARVAAVVEQALPPGYRMAGAPTEYWAVEFFLMWAGIDHPAGGRSQLLVYLDRDSAAAPPAGPEEVCDRPHPGTRFSGEEISCRPIVVDGVPLRVSTSRDELPDDPIPFEFTLVSQFRDGSAVHLWELPYRHPMRGEPVLAPLTGPVFTAAQLAELALDPALATP